MSHSDCQGTAGHVCQQPSGRQCVEVGCPYPAGTWWGPMWCPLHDQERLERITTQMESLFGSGTAREAGS